MTTERFLGIDVAKSHLDVAVRPEGTLFQVANTPEGIADLLARVTPLAPTLIVLEATGRYEQAAALALLRAGLPVAVINPRHGRDFLRATGQSAKTDELDARGLAQFAQLLRPAPMRLKTDALRELEACVRRRQQLVSMRTMEQNRRATAAAVAADSLAAHVTWLTEQIHALDQTIQTRLAEQTEWQDLDTRLQSVPGVGPTVSATLIARLPELGHLPTKRLAALVGVAPLNRDSGRFRGQRHIWGGRSDVRTALYMSARAGLRWNPLLQTFYQRLRDAGKSYKVAITACMHKLLGILNALVRTHREWDAELAKQYAKQT